MKVAIIGAGLAGRLLAWRLVEHCRHTNTELSIALYERESRHHIGTGRVAAAMIAPYTEAVTTDPKTRELGVASWQLWRQWLPELEASTGQTIAFNQRGTLVVAHPADHPDWQRFQQKAVVNTPADQLHLWDNAQLTQQEPELSAAFRQALYFPEEGVLDNDALYTALNYWLDTCPEIQWYEGIDAGFLITQDPAFDTVFDCRGNQAKCDLSTLRSVRGEVLRVHAPEVSLTRAVRLMHPRYPLYIAPHPDHHYVIGATQLESDDDRPVTVRSALELLSALYSLHSGFSEANIQSFRAGLRPAFNDNLPRIIREPRLVRINGLFRHGYLFAPALIHEVIQSIC